MFNIEWFKTQRIHKLHVLRPHSRFLLLFLFKHAAFVCSEADFAFFC